MPILEDHLEQHLLTILQELGYAYECGYDIAPAPDGPRPERDNYRQVWLTGRLQKQLAHLNPHLPPDAIEDAMARLGNLEGGLLARNRQFHKFLRDGVPCKYLHDGEELGALARLVDFETIDNNDWLAVNQFSILGPTVDGRTHTRRPDIILYLNGLPIAVLELKNPAKEKTDIWEAFKQLQTYKEQIPDLFETNELLVIADGATARYGSLTSDASRMMHWRIIEGHSLDPLGPHRETETLVRGLLCRDVLLQFLRDAIVFEDDGGTLTKKVAGFHQFRALGKAFHRALQASAPDGDRKGGVVWHTQGSGKSITMALYAAKVLSAPEMKNPTIVVVTDRNDLDGQLSTTFGHAAELLRQTPQQADDRDAVRSFMQDRASGGVLFTTIQKFLPFTEREHVSRAIAAQQHRGDLRRSAPHPIRL